MKSLTSHLFIKIGLIALFFFISSCSPETKEHFKYLGQKPPSHEPEIFAPDIISKNEESLFGSVFNKECTEFYYGVDSNGKSEIRFSKLEN